MSVTVTEVNLTADVSNDVTVCDSYALPALSANNSYHSAPGGGGQVLTGPITTSQTVYIWASLGTCTDESSFVVTVNQTPVIQPIQNVAACDGYALPALAVGHYYDAADGGGNQLDGTTLTTSQTVYVYAQTGTVPNCSAQQSFTVTITASPVADDPLDVTGQCDSYTLPALTVGNYFTQADGGGTALFAGDQITTSQTLYVYAVSGLCSDQNSFDVAIGHSPSFTIDSGCRGSAYVLEVIPGEGSFDPATADYTWSVTGQGQIVSGNGTSAVEVSGAGDYSVTVSVGGCPHGETVTVDNTGCTIQKGISPNGDGWNDYFDLEGQDVSQLEIFNRYGTVVYKKSNYSTQWHGQSDGGDDLPDGTYYYVIERAQGETKTGWIYINREN